MNILLNGDRHVMSGLEVVIYSTMEHNKNVHWYVFSMNVEVPHPDGMIHGYYGINEDDIRRLRKIITYFDSNSTITLIDTKEEYDALISESVNRCTGFTPYAALRLLADVCLPESVHKTIYLDADTVVMGSLEMLYNDYANNYDYAGYVLPEACEDDGEFNTGVLVFNLDRIRRSGMLARARALYNRKVYNYPDQGAITEAGDYEKLPEIYNYMNKPNEAFIPPTILHITCYISPKIYCTTKAKFYRAFPQFQHIREGLELIESLW